VSVAAGAGAVDSFFVVDEDAAVEWDVGFDGDDDDFL
jgi:hypothetical protein